LVALIAACGGRDSLRGGLGDDDDTLGPAGGSGGVTASTGGASGFGPTAGGTLGTGGSSSGNGGTAASGGSDAGGAQNVGGFNTIGGSPGASGFPGAGASSVAGASSGTAGFPSGTSGSGPVAGASFGGASGLGNAGASFGGSSSGGSSFGGSSVGGAGAAGFGGSGGSTGTLGEPCSTNGALACHGPAQRLRLLCDGGFWQSNGTCVESENCDQRTGVCAPIVAACEDHAPGSLICSGDNLLECGPDLVNTTLLVACEGRCKATSTSAECSAPTCGDGRVHASEECDDGDGDDTDACTNACTTAFCGDGSIYAGREACDDANQLPRDGCSVVCGADAAAIALGYAHSCGLGSSGKVQCWGNNWIGQLGVGDTVNRGFNESEMGPNLPAVALGTGKSAVALSSGADTTCAILNDGGVKCWGSNAGGQLGVGDTANRGSAPNHLGDNLPAVPLGSGRTAIQVAVGHAHACALLDDHSMKCWGYNLHGELGQEDGESRGDVLGELGDALPPIKLGTGRSALAIAAGAYHTCAVLDDFSVKCWGMGDWGQLGLGDPGDRGYASGHMGDGLPTVDLGTGRSARDIAAGEYHSCAVLDDGSVKCWGYGEYGQLGQGDTQARGDGFGLMGDALAPIQLGTGRSAKRVFAGVYKTCAILDNDSVKCWGMNYYGGLGVGDTATRGDGPNEMGDFLPAVSLGSGRTAKSLAVGDSHTCALLDNETVKCWGNNSYGQLGLGLWSTNIGDGAGEMGDNLPYVRATF
jgi:cysteine-rich repeat protein